MTYLILFYGGLIVFGGILLYVINSRAGKNSKTKDQMNAPAEKEVPENEEAQTKEVSRKETDSSEYAMTDDEYREVLRRSLKKQPETETKKEPVRDPDKYSDQEYRDVLRSMHKKLHQNKESDQ